MSSLDKIISENKTGLHAEHAQVLPDCNFRSSIVALESILEKENDANEENASNLQGEISEILLLEIECVGKNEVKSEDNHQDVDIMEVAFKRDYSGLFSGLKERKASLIPSKCEFKKKSFVWKSECLKHDMQFRVNAENQAICEEENEVKGEDNHQNIDVMEVAFKRNYSDLFSGEKKRKASLIPSKCKFKKKSFVWKSECLKYGMQFRVNAENQVSCCPISDSKSLPSEGISFTAKSFSENRKGKHRIKGKCKQETFLAHVDTENPRFGFSNGNNNHPGHKSKPKMHSVVSGKNEVEKKT